MKDRIIVPFLSTLGAHVFHCDQEVDVKVTFRSVQKNSPSMPQTCQGSDRELSSSTTRTINVRLLDS